MKKLLGLMLGFVAFAQHPLVTGAADPRVTQGNIQTTICKAGYTATVRPPANYTTQLKRRQMMDWHLTGKESDYEEDHLISLEIGGHPTDPHNLWPQAYAGVYGARKKDQVEDKLHRMVCAGQMGLVEAQACIVGDWVACGRKIGALK